MGYMIIDGQHVEFTDEKNILSVIRKAGIELPTFCYNSELSIYGACRMCVVEDKRGSIMASCSTPPKDGLEIKTNTPGLRKHRKMILELLLASHCRDCTTCEKSGKCRLQELAIKFDIKNIRFKNNHEMLTIDNSSTAIVRDPNKCILCGDCVRMCSEIQGMGIIDFAYRGSKMRVTPAFDMPIAKTSCVNCGQCAAVCPTGAIVIKNQIQDVWNLLNNPRKRVVAQIAPAVRVALGEEFGIKSGENLLGKIVAVLKRFGFDEVYDTSIGADLTVMEESSEFIERLEKNDNIPMFTSCCPAWVKFVETKHPELLKHISTCRSPMEMFGSVLKEYYKKTKSKDEKDTVVVAVMPCTAKKFEVSREEFKVDGVKNVDISITTQELALMIKESGIIFNEIEPEAADMPFGIVSGAGVIFGVTGGVTEAVLRRCIENKNSASIRELEYIGIRGKEGIKEAETMINGKNVRIAVVNGLKNAEDLIKAIEKKEVHYDFVEVMACPEGCIGGAGQPFARHYEMKNRAKGIYRADKMSQIKCSDENPVIKELYNSVLKNRKKELLHVHYV